MEIIHSEYKLISGSPLDSWEEGEEGERGRKQKKENKN